MNSSTKLYLSAPEIPNDVILSQPVNPEHHFGDMIGHQARDRR